MTRTWFGDGVTGDEPARDVDEAEKGEGARPTVLLVEDDARLAALVRGYLDEHGFTVDVVTRGDRAADRIRQTNPDVVLLDIGLPGQDGLSVCREIRAGYAGAIVMMTARGDEIDEVLGLEIGADDYVAKPVRPRALVARLRANLRRIAERTPRAGERGVRVVGALSIDPGQRTVCYRGARVPVSTSEFELLEILARRAGHTVSREELLGESRGLRYDGLNRSIDLRISRLRRKLGDDSENPELIVSVRGVGYMLVTRP
ncbi:response regulator [Pendulispora albinea]|uniref:Response regulator transcription factor n=1 Tax=Pendulispora albinea TaxID=2741071 RepID=A0ABZ2M5S9_9BACT